MKNIFFTFIILAISIHSINAQKWSVGMNFFYDEALQDYDKNLDSNPLGVSFVGLYNIPNSRLSIGADIGVAMYYSDTYWEDLSERGHSEALAEVYEEDCYFTYNAIARYDMAYLGPITPYVEVKIGGASYFTSKDYNDFSGSNAPNSINSDFDVHGTSLKTGAGAGLVFNFGMMKSEPYRSLVSIDLGAIINNGTRTDYRSIRPSDTPIANSDNYYNSKTNNVVYRVGVLFNF